jgi:hypothetical protein
MRLKSFVPEALGIAAAAGNKEALAMLLGISELSANDALCLPAQSNGELAVDYFVTRLNSDKPFKTGVGQVMNVPLSAT